MLEHPLAGNTKISRSCFLNDFPDLNYLRMLRKHLFDAVRVWLFCMIAVFVVYSRLSKKAHFPKRKTTAAQANITRMAFHESYVRKAYNVRNSIAHLKRNVSENI